MKPPYEVTEKILNLNSKLYRAIGLCEGIILTKPDVAVRKVNSIKTIHSTLSIEGNAFSLNQVTSIIENKRVMGPKDDITEVMNANLLYNNLNTFDPYDIKSFLSAHEMMLSGLISEAGTFRTKQVGVVKDEEVIHLAPHPEMVPSLIKDLFNYIKKCDELDVIKACVFHYELEFIHPFTDGNGRMGRLWQKLLLMKIHPIFEYVPFEEIIYEKQMQYYRAIETSNKNGNSTVFIEYMLKLLYESLIKVINDNSNITNSYERRAEYALNSFDSWFSRKDYMALIKTISTATASRDLKQMINDGLVEVSGDKRLTQYKKAIKDQS